MRFSTVICIKSILLTLLLTWNISAATNRFPRSYPAIEATFQDKNAIYPGIFFQLVEIISKPLSASWATNLQNHTEHLSDCINTLVEFFNKVKHLRVSISKFNSCNIGSINNQW